MNEQISTHHDEHSFWIPSNSISSRQVGELSKQQQQQRSASTPRAGAEEQQPAAAGEGSMLEIRAFVGSERRPWQADEAKYQRRLHMGRLNIRKRKELTS